MYFLCRIMAVTMALGSDRDTLRWPFKKPYISWA